MGKPAAVEALQHSSHCPNPGKKNYSEGWRERSENEEYEKGPTQRQGEERKVLLRPGQ